MIEPVGDVEREFVVDPLVFRSDFDGAVDIDHEVAAPGFGFAGHGVIAKTDDVGGAVFPEIFAVGLSDAVVVDEYDGNFVPDRRCGSGFKFSTEPISQLLELFSMDRMVCLMI